MLRAMRWLPFRRRSTPAPAVPPDLPGLGEATLVQDAVPGLPPTPGARPADTEAAEPAPLGHVGRYALKSVLGEGGLGTVYAAWDPLLSRPVAVKMLRPVDSRVDTPDAALDMPRDELILHEARAAARLSHPHIVTIHDAGRSEQGIYIAMEPLRGRDLRHLLREGWRPGALEVAHLARHVAEALDYAHGKGVIHCDVKPANIFMVGRKQPKLLDFGIARVTLEESARGPSGPLAGSPYYLAPEQLRGEPVDRRCDVYALGVVMYELLTGARPYQGHDLDAIAHAVLTQDQPQAHTGRREVPPGLSAIVARAMARAPIDRHRSARHLAQQLRHWLDSDEARLTAPGRHSPPPTRPVTTAAADRVTAWWRMAHPGHGAAVLLAAALALTAIGLGAWRMRQDHPAPPLPQDPAPLTLRSDWHSEPPATVADGGGEAPAPAPAMAQDATRPDRMARSSSSVKPGPRTLPSTAPAGPVATPEGTVQLAISPWGLVKVDGRDIGVTPPLTELRLPEGSHTITVHNGDLPVYSQRVVVVADQRTQVQHRFQP